jgi:hypothetical protein
VDDETPYVICAKCGYETPLSADQLKAKLNAAEVGFDTRCGGCGVTIKAKTALGLKAHIKSLFAKPFRK